MTSCICTCSELRSDYKPLAYKSEAFGRPARLSLTKPTVLCASPWSRRDPGRRLIVSPAHKTVGFVRKGQCEQSCDCVPCTASPCRGPWASYARRRFSKRLTCKLAFGAFSQSLKRLCKRFQLKIHLSQLNFLKLFFLEY